MKGGGREERIRKMRGKGGRGKEMGGGKKADFHFPLFNPLTTDKCTHHSTLTACYQLA